MSGGLTFGVLGTLRVSDGSSPIVFDAAKQRVILARLLLSPEGSATTAELCSALWGERLPSRPRAAVHNYVRRLRQRLPGEVIATTSAGYRLTPGSLKVDLHLFRDLVASARRLGGAGLPAEESATLREALALWRGAPLADVPSEQLHREEVPVLNEERIGAVERRVAVDLELGRHSALVGELRTLTDAFPLRERFWSQLMLALHRDGRTADALAAYHQVRNLLAREAGVSPGVRLQTLHRGMVTGDPRLVAAPPRPVSRAPGGRPAPAAADGRGPAPVGTSRIRAGEPIRAAAVALLRSLLPDDRAAREPVAAARLAELCGHSPQAVRIAAAHLRHRPGVRLGDYVSELESYV